MRWSWGRRSAGISSYACYIPCQTRQTGPDELPQRVEGLDRGLRTHRLQELSEGLCAEVVEQRPCHDPPGSPSSDKRPGSYAWRNARIASTSLSKRPSTTASTRSPHSDLGVAEVDEGGDRPLAAGPLEQDVIGLQVSVSDNPRDIPRAGDSLVQDTARGFATPGPITPLSTSSGRASLRLRSTRSSHDSPPSTPSKGPTSVR